MYAFATSGKWFAHDVDNVSHASVFVLLPRKHFRALFLVSKTQYCIGKVAC